MDSQENVLNNEAQLEETNQQPVAEEVVKQEENVVTPEPAAEEPAAEEEATEETASKKVYATKKEVIERIKELAHGDESPTKEEVDLLKTTFYKLPLLFTSSFSRTITIHIPFWAVVVVLVRLISP